MKRLINIYKILANRKAEFYFFLGPLGILLLISNVFFVYKWNVLEIAVITTFVLFLFYLGLISNKPKTKILWISTAAYLGIKALLLPLMFLTELNQHDGGITVNAKIANYERLNELRSVNSYFSPSDTAKINVLQTLLNSKNPQLDREFKIPLSLFSIPVARIDTFIIECKHDWALVGRRHEAYKVLSINGNIVGIVTIAYPVRIPHKNSDMYMNEFTPRYVILQTIERLKWLKENTEKRRGELKQDKMIWTYSMILPYILFNSDFIEFSTPFTISIHGLSNILCEALLLAIIATILSDILLNYKKTDSNGN